MYGDCQVLSSMGGNAVGESLFSSNTSSFCSPNLHFFAGMPFQQAHSIYNPMLQKEEMEGVRGRDEEIDSRSGSANLDGGLSGEEHEAENSKKKKYHRHTPRQIQEMEAVFKECPHPDDKQRLRLSQELGLKPRQVKFWFQNRRTQMKAQQDRSDNAALRSENERLKTENYRLQASLKNVTCPNCRGPAIIGEIPLELQRLRTDNAQLNEELKRLSCMLGKFSGRPTKSLGPPFPAMAPSLELDMSLYSRYFHDSLGCNPPPPNCMDMVPPTQLVQLDHVSSSSYPQIGLLESEKALAVDCGVSAVEELLRMSQDDEGLWMKMGDGFPEVLNHEEHSRIFSQWPMGSVRSYGAGWRVEGSRDTGLVILNSITLAEAFMDADKWMEMFPCIVSKARILQIISTGSSDRLNGSLQLMCAEFIGLSPLIPSRDFIFFRFCQQVCDGTFVIVDFPVDGFNETVQMASPNYRRRPSGIVIQDAPNGYAKVIWVEHAQVIDRPVHHLFSHLVQSGVAFGAQRWVSVLQRQCERLASLMSTNLLDQDMRVIDSVESRRNVMRVAQRMVRIFSHSISWGGGQTWTGLAGASNDTLRVMTIKPNLDNRDPSAAGFLIGVSSTWLPYSHLRVFDLLRDACKRAQLDLLTTGLSTREVAHIANGSHHGNCISLLRVNSTTNSMNPIMELMLQETCTDTSGSLVVFAPISISMIHMVLGGSDISPIPLAPCGFHIMPGEAIAGPGNIHAATSTATSPGPSTPAIAGCILTVGYQMESSSPSTTRIASVESINAHITNTVCQINAALGGPNHQSDP